MNHLEVLVQSLVIEKFTAVLNTSAKYTDTKCNIIQYDLMRLRKIR